VLGHPSSCSKSNNSIKESKGALRKELRFYAMGGGRLFSQCRENTRDVKGLVEAHGYDFKMTYVLTPAYREALLGSKQVIFMHAEKPILKLTSKTLPPARFLGGEQGKVRSRDWDLCGGSVRD